MLHSAHITSQPHASNSSIIHWLQTNPALGCLLVVATSLILYAVYRYTVSSSLRNSKKQEAVHPRSSSNE